MDHYLRDDPRWWVDFHDKTGPGNAANRLVHESCVQGDCDIVDSKWFDVGKRDLFVKVYGMTPEEGRALSECTCFFFLSFLAVPGFPPSPPF